MTSFAHQSVREGNYMPTYKILGQTYHRIGPILPAEGRDHVYLQIYFMGNSQEQVARRADWRSGTHKDILGPIQEMLQSVNPFVKQFKTAFERRRTIGPDHKIIIRADRTPVGEHQRCINSPATDEVAVLIAAPEGASRRDIVLEWQDAAEGRGGIKRIHELNPAYDPLQYPILFPYGEDGYTTDLPRNDPETGLPHTDPETGEPMAGSRRKITQKEFYAYRFMVRPRPAENQLHLSRDLFSQYAVDMYAKVILLFTSTSIPFT